MTPPFALSRRCRPTQAAEQGRGLRRRAQEAAKAAVPAAVAEEDPFYGKAVDLEGQPRSSTDEGARLAAAVGGAMLDSGFGLDWESVARDVSSGAVEVEIDADGGDKSLASRAAEGLTSRSHWPFCAWDATTYVLGDCLLSKRGGNGCWVGLTGLTRRLMLCLALPCLRARDANIYTPLLLDPNAVYQPQLLSFGSEGTNRVYRFKAP